MAKKFRDLSEREILALAISLEEEDARMYVDYADGLRDTYPDTAKIFDEMRGKETEHHNSLTEMLPEPLRRTHSADSPRGREGPYPAPSGLVVAPLAHQRRAQAGRGYGLRDRLPPPSKRKRKTPNAAHAAFDIQQPAQEAGRAKERARNDESLGAPARTLRHCRALVLRTKAAFCVHSASCLCNSGSFTSLRSHQRAEAAAEECRESEQTAARSQRSGGGPAWVIGSSVKSWFPWEPAIAQVLWKAAAAHQVPKPPVGAQRIESRRSKRQRIKVVLVGLFQQGHRLIFVVQTCVDQGLVGGIREAVIRPAFQLVQ